MMDRTPKKGDDKGLLEAIIYYCGEIENSLDYFSRDEIKFMENRHFQHDCSFCISQIGEFTGKLSEELKSKYPDVAWSSITGMRNVVVHDYGGIELPLVWGSATEDVPMLRDICKRILKDIS
jgi:uncharacterized protein with HEPN domain